MSIVPAAIVTSVLAGFAGLALLCFQGWRHEQKEFRRDEQQRQDWWQQATGAKPPVLTDAEEAEFRAIKSRLRRQDAGLNILRERSET